MIWQRAVLPVVVVYAGVLVVLFAASRTEPAGRRPVRARWSRLAAHVSVTALGGFATFLAGMTVYCSLRGIDFSVCIALAATHGAAVALAGTAGMVLLEAVVRIKT